MAGTYASIAIKKLFPHPEIKQVLAQSLAAFRPDNYSFLSDETLMLMQKIKPLHAIENRNGRVVFFAGWDFLSELQRRNIDAAWVVIHKKEPDRIDLWALQNELSQSVFIRENTDLKRQYFYELLKNNKPLWGRIFSKSKPRSVVSALQRLCNLSRGEARGVKKRNASEETILSPLELLLAAKQEADND